MDIEYVEFCSEAVCMMLKELGYNIIEKFIPEVYTEYEADITYNIESNQYLGDIDIKFKKDKINHIFAGCGFGKTTWTKKLGKTKRVCVISPLTSINKDAFSEENGWLVLDNNYKDIVKHIFNGDVYEALNSHWNICTTWESFSLYKIYQYNFDYFIIDEIHTLYMYDYRLNSIRHLKDDFPKAKGIKVVMTGTPSYELNEFDCWKIKINKEQPKTKAEFLFYNESNTGWIYKDIKEWTKNENNVAIIFKDQANYKDVDNMALEGIDCDIFNSNYKENVEYILNENNVKNNVTIFSVYGQAGINLYIDLEKKVRLYILNKNALGIIQYANRVRNKQVIDKIIIPFKKSKINNKIYKIDEDIDIDEAMRKVDVLNSTLKSFDIFDSKQKSILLLRFGFVTDCLDRVADKVELNIPNYKIYKMINNVDDYEKQIQIMYNRLIENDFEVCYNYLVKDVKTNKNTKMRSNQLAGNIVNFDFSQIKYDKEGNIYIKPNDKLLKVSTGNLLEILTNIFNYIRKSGGNIEEIYCTYDPETRSGLPGSARKVKGTLHWVSAQHAVDATVRLYDRLFEVENPAAESERDFREMLNPESLKTIEGIKVEPFIAENATNGHKFQFQRIGYFTPDYDSTPEKLIFNRTIALKDSWEKAQKK